MPPGLVARTTMVGLCIDFGLGETPFEVLGLVAVRVAGVVDWATATIADTEQAKAKSVFFIIPGWTEGLGKECATSGVAVLPHPIVAVKG